MSTIGTSNQTFKIVLIGDTDTGKTSIISKFHKDIFENKTQSTIGAEFNSIPYKTPDGHLIDLHMWDTAGQERYRGLVSLYFKKAYLILFVFDVSNDTSLKNIKDWFDIYQREKEHNVTFNPILILVGNKCDIKKSTDVNTNLIESYIKEFGFIYYETSAKTGENLSELFISIKDKACADYDKYIKNTTTEPNSGDADNPLNRRSFIHLDTETDNYYIKSRCCYF